MVLVGRIRFILMTAVAGCLLLTGAVYNLQSWHSPLLESFHYDFLQLPLDTGGTIQGDDATSVISTTHANGDDDDNANNGNDDPDGQDDNEEQTDPAPPVRYEYGKSLLVQASTSGISLSVDTTRRPECHGLVANTHYMKSTRSPLWLDTYKKQLKRGRVPIVQYGTKPANRKRLKLPYPILNVGLAKSGTTSVADFFTCGNITYTSHYYCSATPPEKVVTKPFAPRADFCGLCIKAAVDAGCDPLQSCGNYDVWGQLEALPSANNPLCYFPQISALQALHEASPNATLVLPLRPVQDWIRSVQKWGKTRANMEARCHDTVLPHGASDEQLAALYLDHANRIRQFARDYPTHALVEVNIYSPEAGQIMSDAFGIPATCWRHANKNQGDHVEALRRQQQQLRKKKQPKPRPQFVQFNNHNNNAETVYSKVFVARQNRNNRGRGGGQQKVVPMQNNAPP